jgi:hypothetical protein
MAALDGQQVTVNAPLSTAKRFIERIGSLGR